MQPAKTYFGQMVRAYRQQRGWSQGELCKAVFGHTDNNQVVWLSRVERAKVAHVTDKVERLGEFMGLTAYDTRRALERGPSPKLYQKLAEQEEKVPKVRVQCQEWVHEWMEGKLDLTPKEASLLLQVGWVRWEEVKKEVP
jgi:transcriptional regulator with XRE-family HTH domain